jgi:hypothetical protein
MLANAILPFSKVFSQNKPPSPQIIILLVTITIKIYLVVVVVSRWPVMCWKPGCAFRTFERSEPLLRW